MLAYKQIGKSALSAGYFLALLFIFTIIAIQGPIVVAKLSPSADSILRNNLFPFDITSLPLFQSETVALLDFYFMIIFGFIASYAVSKTFQKLFDLGGFLTFFVTLLFLSPYYSPLVFGINVINNGYAYPIFLLCIRYLLEGLVFKNYSSYVKFFIFTSIAIILRRQFIFLPVVGLVSLIYSFTLDKEVYYGKKTFLVIALILSFVVPDLSERTNNYLSTGEFISVPFIGLQFAVTPLYVSKLENLDTMNSQAVVELFNTIRQPLLDKGLILEASPEDDAALMLKYRNFFEKYDDITYTTLRPIIQQIASLNPSLVDTGLIGISLSLIFANFADYVMVLAHNIIYHMGGYFMAGLMILIFITSFTYHIQYRGRFSLVALVVTLVTFSNYTLVALIEPVTQEYAFYTDSFSQVLLFCLVSYLFRKQRGVDRVDSITLESETWKKKSVA